MNSSPEWARQLKQFLEIEQAFGISEIPRPVASLTSADASSLQKKREALDALFQEFKDCRQCPLSATRTQVVFGSGDPAAELMFIGEAPGFDEDKQGEPFVGAAGQLLTKIIEAMHLSREKVYIANCLKCRPPGNRNPLPDEINACNPILMRQIDIIRPKIICALGKFAAQTLLGTEEPISRLRGRFFDWKLGARLMPTFHPAYLLRNPADKKFVWTDMQLIMKELSL